MGFYQTSFIGNGSGITGIVTNLVAGDNISLNNSTGTVTITGLTKTDRINALFSCIGCFHIYYKATGLVSIENTVSIAILFIVMTSELVVTQDLMLLVLNFLPLTKILLK